MKKITFALFAMLLLTACHKDKTKTALLTDHCWVITAITSDPPLIVNGVPVTDAYAQLPDCTKDNISCLQANGTYTSDEGPSRCNSIDPQVTTGNWTFNKEETVVTAVEDGTFTTIEAEIIELTETTLRYRVLATESNGIKYFFTFTAKPG